MKSSPVIISGTSHLQLAEGIARELKAELMPVLIERFASNEIYVRLQESVRGRNVYVVQTSTKNVNEDYIELFLLLNALKRSFAKSVHLIMPHYGYARQDRIALPRETISAQLMADLLVTSGADHMVTVDLHSAQIQGFFRIPVDNIDPMKLFLSAFKDIPKENLVVVAPDVGGAKAVRKLANALGVPMVLVNKHRQGHNQSEVTHVIGEVEGKTCLIFDDLIDTAGSVCNAKAALINAGANGDVYLAASHPVFSGPAVQRLNAADFKQIFVTDSIPLPAPPPEQVTVLSLAPMLAEIIRRNEEGESVSGMY
jgi:ribose-phosphate pyrophosphokinase